MVFTICTDDIEYLSSRAYHENIRFDIDAAMIDLEPDEWIIHVEEEDVEKFKKVFKGKLKDSNCVTRPEIGAQFC